MQHLSRTSPASSWPPQADRARTHSHARAWTPGCRGSAAASISGYWPGEERPAAADRGADWCSVSPPRPAFILSSSSSYLPLRCCRCSSTILHRCEAGRTRCCADRASAVPAGPDSGSGSVPWCCRCYNAESSRPPAASTSTHHAQGHQSGRSRREFQNKSEGANYWKTTFLRCVPWPILPKKYREHLNNLMLLQVNHTCVPSNCPIMKHRLLMRHFTWSLHATAVHWRK